MQEASTPKRSPPQTPRGLRFDMEVLGKPQQWTVFHRGIEYPGEVIVSDTVNPDWGQALTGSTMFRLVFYTVPRRIPAGQIRDARIAMAVPRRSASQGWHNLNREISAVQEAIAEYSTAADSRPDHIRQTMKDLEVSVRDELAHLYTLSFSQGRIYARTGTFIAPADVFVEDTIESWTGRLASSVLLSAFPKFPVDHESFPSPLTGGGIRALFKELYYGDSESSEQVRAYGPGLGLTKRDDPSRPDAGGCEAIRIIEGEVETGDGLVPAQDLLHTLSHTHGLPRLLATLYLLTWVRHARAEVELKADHSVEDRHGKEFLSDYITWGLVPEVSLSESLADQLQVVRRKPALTWSTALPYTALVSGGLEAATEPADVAVQDGRLIVALEELGRRLEDSRQGLTVLAESLGSKSDETSDTLDQLQMMCAAAGFRSFHSVVEQAFEGPTGLRRALDLHTRLERLSGLALTITLAKLYLSEMNFGPAHQDMALERDSVAARIGLDSLLVDPSLWESIEESFQRLRARYAPVYIKHHLRYYREAAEQRRRLEWLSLQVEALARFNGVSELGEPVGVDITPRFTGLTSAIRTCSVEMPSLDAAPYCHTCLLRLDEDVPAGEAELLSADTETALREYNRRIGSHSVRQILAHPTREQLDKFIDLVHVSDLSSLANVLDDDVMEFLRQFLRSK